MYERLIAEREARFEILDRIRAHLPDLPPKEVAQDVAEAIAVRNTLSSESPCFRTMRSSWPVTLTLQTPSLMIQKMNSYWLARSTAKPT